MRKPILVSTCLVLANVLSAQSSHITGVDLLTVDMMDTYAAAALLGDGGQLTCAIDNGAIVLIRTNGQGDLQWQKALEFDGGAGWYDVFSCGEWNNGDLFLFGPDNGSGTGAGYFVARLTPQGDPIWTRAYEIGSMFGWDYGTSRAHALSNGHLLLSIAQFTHMIAADVDEDGDMGYIRSFAFDDEKCPGLGCEPTLDGGAIFCGKDSSDQCLVRLDASGTVFWARTYENNDYTHARGVLPTADGGFLVCGSHDNDYGGYGDAAYAMKLDATGDVLWHKTYAIAGGSPFLNRFERVVGLTGGGFAFFTDGMFGDQVLVVTDAMGVPVNSVQMHHPEYAGYLFEEMLGVSGSQIRLGGYISLTEGTLATVRYLDRAVSASAGESDCLAIPVNVLVSDVAAPSYPNAEVVIATPTFVQTERSLAPIDREASSLDVCEFLTGIEEPADSFSAVLRPNLAVVGATVELFSPGLRPEQVMAVDALGRYADLPFTRMNEGALLSTAGLSTGHYTVRVVGETGAIISLPLVVQ